MNPDQRCLRTNYEYKINKSRVITVYGAIRKYVN